MRKILLSLSILAFGFAAKAQTIADFETPKLPKADKSTPLLPAVYPLPAASALGRRARTGLRHFHRGRRDPENARAHQ